MEVVMKKVFCGIIMTVAGFIFSCGSTPDSAGLEGSSSGVQISATTGVEGALARVAETLTEKLPKKSLIAILNVASQDRNMAVLAVNKLEFQLGQGWDFGIVTRTLLDPILAEQNFQIFGEVDDNSAVSIGKLFGANIVITGSISGISPRQKLTIKALDVQTAQIVTMIQEQF
jgi:hypothetical protein